MMIVNSHAKVFGLGERERGSELVRKRVCMPVTMYFTGLSAYVYVFIVLLLLFFFKAKEDII